jgi:hypothetical protein
VFLGIPHFNQTVRVDKWWAVQDMVSGFVTGISKETEIKGAEQRRATVSSVKITGLETKSVSTIYPVDPQFPAHIY